MSEISSCSYIDAEKYRTILWLRIIRCGFIDGISRGHQLSRVSDARWLRKRTFSGNYCIQSNLGIGWHWLVVWWQPERKGAMFLAASQGRVYLFHFLVLTGWPVLVDSQNQCTALPIPQAPFDWKLLGPSRNKLGSNWHLQMVYNLKLSQLMARVVVHPITSCILVYS